MHPDPHAGTLAAELQRTTGLNAAACYQCGKCTAGCPMAAEMPLKTHQLIRMVQLDKRERLLADESMWLCLTCETCSSRCPNHVDPARLIDGLRELAWDGGRGAPGRIAGFHRAFLGQIRGNGRVHEMGLVMSYKLRTGALFADVTAAPGMLARGKLSLAPTSIEGLAEVRKIFEACTPAAKEGSA